MRNVAMTYGYKVICGKLFRKISERIVIQYAGPDPSE